MSTTSTEHIEQYHQLHRTKRYGVSGYKFASHIKLCALELRPQVVLDYGCGQTNLADAVDFLGASFHRYDPAIPEISRKPVEKADLVVNTDVLEHVPQECIDPLLGDIASLSSHAFFSIATSLAQEILPNGQNAHCSIKTGDEWLATISRHFPQSEILRCSRKNTVLILTWQSRVRDLIEQVDEHYKLKRRAEKLSLGRLFRKFR